MKKLIALVLLATALSASLYAQDVPPPPRPDDTGPTLEFTVKYIQDGLNSITAEWKETYDVDQPQLIRFKASDAKVDRQSGVLSFNAVRQQPWVGTTEPFSFRLNFRDIGKLTVESFEDYQAQKPFGAQFTPSGYVLLIKMAPGKTAHRHDNTVYTTPAWLKKQKNAKKTRAFDPDADVSEVPVFVLDQELAQRLAKAMVHAVELYGGSGDRDPFR